MENWLPIPDWEDLYEVSDAGRIKRLPRSVRNGNGLVHLPERIVKTTLSRKYLVVNLWRNNTPKLCLVHRLVALAFIGRSELSVDHINGVTTDNALSNLRYCTLAENTRFQHAAGRARFVRGVENGKSKLAPDSVREIRRLLGEGLTARQAGAVFHVSKETVAAIRSGRTWSHVE